ncbi:adenosine kinase [Spirochaetia bacterium]|nr:adenosine kinase [Spirochaetia bacterium]
MSKRAEILCIGNPVVDVFSEVAADFPAQWELSAPVQHIPYDKVIEILSTLLEPVAVSGGGAANVAKIASLLGVSTAFAGAVGTDRNGGPDHYARWFEKNLKTAGVNPLLSRGTLPTGLCLLLKPPQGDPVVAACPSAALQLTPEDIPADRIREARVVVIDGYILGRDALVQRILDASEESGTVVALDVGSVSQAAAHAREIARYCRKYPLILFMNEEEAEAYYRVLDQGGGEAPESADIKPGRDIHHLSGFFRKNTVGDFYPIIVIKRGSRGALVFAGGVMHRAETLSVIPRDVTGAGDAFCAAFLAAWLQNKPLYDCAVLGNKTAAEVLNVPGTQIDRKKLDALARLLGK